MFESKNSIFESTWQAFERDVCRFLPYLGFTNVRLVGQTGDRGADVTASRQLKDGRKKYLFQVKHWKKPVGEDVVQETLRALQEYEADIPVIVASTGFDSTVYEHQKQLLKTRIPLQLWGPDFLIEKAKQIAGNKLELRTPRRYQEPAISEITSAYFSKHDGKALVVMATGLGKTYVAAESIRRIRASERIKVLVCAHTNDLVYQLEKAFWAFLSPMEKTLIWNSYEKPTLEKLKQADITFACIDSVSNWINKGQELPEYGLLLVDECHHVGASMYSTLFDELQAGKVGNTFALGVTATPWRPDEIDITKFFGSPRFSMDMVEGLKLGFLANVDYRMYTSNIDWSQLSNIQGKSYSPKQINRTLFIDQWDDEVVHMLQLAWAEQNNPRAIIFCGTIEHALIMRDKINALGFSRARAIYSGSSGSDYERLSQFDRNRILSDFADGVINVVCAVDIFNEGIDVPDVNILVFQRVTHSRRIFIQQLGRGLRIAEDKDKVIVLDFVSDVRRFAAGISLKNELEAPSKKGIARINLPNKVTFMRAGKEDPKTESFLREWLQDTVAIEAADEDASILQFPPDLSKYI